MIAKDLKVGYPLYYIESTRLKFENAIVHSIEKVEFQNKSVYRITLVEPKQNKYAYIGYTDIKIDDKVYLTCDDYANRMIETDGCGNIQFYEENSTYWNVHKEEFKEIKRKASKYRIRKFLNKLIYAKDIR